MTKSKALRVLTLAAVSVLGVAPVAMAQYLVDTSRTLDANNRIGSTGYNGSYTQTLNNNGNQIVTGNQVITGNVTAGREFRGFVPYRDPYSFRGSTPGTGLDAFVKNSAGIPSPYTESNRGINTPQPFYG